MVEFKIRVHPKQRQAYIPKEIVESIGFKLKARPNQFAVILFPDGVDLKLVAESVENLLKEIRCSIEYKNNCSRSLNENQEMEK